MTETAPPSAAHAVTYTQANRFQRGLRRFAATTPGSWLFATVLQRLDRPVYRATRGRHTLANLLSGLPVVLLTTTGARSGLQRTVPVLGVPTTEGLAVIASNFGRAGQPGWYHNLRADPAAAVTVDGVRRPVRAVEAAGTARERIWEQGLRYYPGWRSHERQARGRSIGVFLLLPAGSNRALAGNDVPPSARCGEAVAFRCGVAVPMSRSGGGTSPPGGTTEESS